jgi:hypothetical protein
MAKQSRLVDNVITAEKNLKTLTYSFTRRYEIARNQIKAGDLVEISTVELQSDLIALRRAAAALIREVATVESAIEDLIS